MLEDLIKISHYFLTQRDSTYQRYFIRSSPFSSRMSIVLGPRGVGKTTTLIQALLAFVKGDRFDKRILYVQADHFLVGSLSLYEIAEQFQMIGGKWLAIDEIHKYSNWSAELKSIYDTFPHLIILASGSSALEVLRGSHDLSRRALVYRMQGMSFREYLELNHQLTLPTYTLKELCEYHSKNSHELVEAIEKQGLKVIPEFHRYLQIGYYPYFQETGSEAAYRLTLEQMVHITIESDLASIYPHLNGITLNKIKKLFIYIASSVPFIPNWNKVQQALEIGDARTLKDYFCHLEDAGLIRTVSKATQKFSKLESSSKVFLDNPNQLYALCTEMPEKGTVRETFFLTMLSQQHNITLPIDGDFLIDHTLLFEIGGKNKTMKQVKSHPHSYLACDEMEHGAGNKIPLWLFGFLY